MAFFPVGFYDTEQNKVYHDLAECKKQLEIAKEQAAVPFNREAEYKEKRIFPLTSISDEFTKELSDYLSESGYAFSIAGREEIYALDRLPGYIEEICKLSSQKISYIKSLDEIAASVLQLAVYDLKDVEKEAEKLRKKWTVRLNIFPSGPGMLDLTPNNKGDAMLKVA